MICLILDGLICVRMDFCFFSILGATRLRFIAAQPSSADIRSIIYRKKKVFVNLFLLKC